MTRAALLFDLDGTLVESDHLHHAAFNAILAEHDRRLSFADYTTQVMGQPNSAIMAGLFPHGAPEDHARLADRKEALFRASLAARVEPVAGIYALLDWAEANDIALAVITNAPRANATAMLESSGLAQRLRTVIIGDECASPKPDPLPYRMVMEALGALPSRSVAFEDSRSGLQAARASGARVFGLATGLGPNDLLQAGAHGVIADFTDPALWAYLETLRARAA